MQAIILAGGLGTRLQAEVADRPKPMADIGGRPFLEYLLDFVRGYGLERAILAVSYRREVIESHFGSEYGGVEVVYSVETQRRGTGGAILQALERVTSAQAVILNGDTLFNVNLKRLIDFHAAKAADLTVALRAMPDCERYGTVEVDAAGRITGFREKQARTAGSINGGIYVIDKSWITGRDWPHVFSFEKDVLQALYRQRRFFGLPFDDYFIDIGIPEDYQRACRELPA